MSYRIFNKNKNHINLVVHKQFPIEIIIKILQYRNSIIISDKVKRYTLYLTDTIPVGIIDNYNIIFICFNNIIPIGLHEVSERLRNDKEIVLEAVRINGNLFEYASENLKNDDEFVFKVINIDIKSLIFASYRLKTAYAYFTVGKKF